MPSLDALTAPSPAFPDPAPLPASTSAEEPFTPSLDNVTTQSILFRPLGLQAMIFNEEEGGKISGSFILDGEHAL